MANEKPYTFKDPEVSSTGGAYNEYRENPLQAETARENLLGSNALSRVAEAAGLQHYRSLISPERIAKLRQEALQSIGRGGRFLESFGKYAGMETPELMGLQATLGSKPFTAAGVTSNPIYDFTPYAQAAQAETAQNKQAGLAELDKITPSLMNVQGAGEQQYSSPDILQQTWDRNYGINAANAQAAQLGAGAVSEERRAKNAEQSGSTRSGETVFNTILGQFKAGISQPTMTIDEKSLEGSPYKSEVEAYMPTDQKQIIQNRNVINPQAIADDKNKYSPNGMLSVNNIKKTSQEGINRIRNMDDKTLDPMNYKKLQGFAGDQDLSTISTDSIWQQLGKKALGNTQLGTYMANMKPILMSLPENEQRQFLEQMNSGQFNPKAVADKLELASKNAEQTYYQGNTIANIAPRLKAINSGGNYDVLKSNFSRNPLFGDSEEVNIGTKSKPNMVPVNQLVNGKIQEIVQSPNFAKANATAQLRILHEVMDQDLPDYINSLKKNK